MDLKTQARQFVASREQREREALRRVAMLCTAGIDVDRLPFGDLAQRDLLRRRLSRLIERERIRGVNRHWSYDLNRHIALKQALDDLCGPRPETKKPAPRGRRRLVAHAG